MNKKSYGLIALSLVFALLFPSFAMAAVTVVDKSGSIFAGDPYYNSEKNSYTVDFSTNTVATIKLQSWSAGFGTMLRERVINAADDGYTYMIGNNFTCNTSYKAFYYSASGIQLGSLTLVVDSLVDPTCDSGGAGETPSDKECDACAVFECPGWDEYMAKLDGIKGAIPAPPDWDKVAGTFRDTIAPKIKQDLQDVLGTAPTPPSAPTAPSIQEPSVPSTPDLPSSDVPDAPAAPPKLDGVDDGGIQAPTGKEAPGLGDSGFSSDDIKSSAPKIEERQDPTGGFTITDPMAGLPSQDEYQQLVPPGTGGGGFETAPMPPGTGGNDHNTAPLPEGSGSSTPTAPMPEGSGQNHDTAPMPEGSGKDFGIPIPGESNENRP